MKIVVCLLSGGVDSTVAAVLKAKEPDTLVALLSVYYGQGAEESERLQSAKVADWLKDHYPNIIEHFCMRIDGEVRWTKGVQRIARGFVGWRSPEGGWSQSGYPSTRDEAFTLIAAAGTERFLCDIPGTTSGEIVLATTGEDLCNFEDIEADTYTCHLNAVLARKMMPRGGKPMRIDLPLIEMTKAEVIRKAMEIGAPLELTWSCYFGEPGKPCGACDQCIWRKKAFEGAGILDPVIRTGST